MKVLKRTFGLGIGQRVQVASGVLKYIDRNADIVKSGGYLAITTNNYNIGLGSLGMGRSFINKSNLLKIRQSDYINKIAIALQSTNGYSDLFFDVWRKDGSTYDRIHHVGLMPISSDGINYITLVTPILVNEGDFVGISGISLVNGGTLFSTTAIGSLAYNNTIPNGTDYDWSLQSELSLTFPLIVYSKAPLVVGIGDSIMAGHPYHYSFIENSEITNISTQILYQLKNIDSKYIYQNMGIGSQNTTSIKNRFINDVVDLKPKIAIINGGVNDLAGGITKATFISNWTSMLEYCKIAGIIPVVCKIIPWTNGTNTQMQSRDNWMVDLKALVDTYNGSVYVDFDAAIGKNRANGDDGNLWDIKTEYNADGVHLNQLGYAKMAEIIDLEIKKKYRL